MKRLAEGKAINGCRFRYGKKQANNRRQKVWSVKHTVDGKQINEGLGTITQSRALEIAAELKNNKALNRKNAGKGVQRHPETYSEMQAVLESEKQADKTAAEAEKLASITFRDFFARFVHDRETEGRPYNEIVKHWSRYKKWIGPVIGGKRPSDVTLFDLKRLVKRMSDNGAAPATTVQVIGIISHCYSHNAIHHNYTNGNPVIRKEVLPPKIKKHDNKRERYLNPMEAKQLLAALPDQIAAMATLSLFCGFRAGELFSLKWADVNFITKRISIRDTKSGRARTVAMGRDVVALLQPMEGKNGELLFPNPKGGQYREIPKAFKATVDRLGLNNGIEDRRQRVVFHSMRHTCASWLVDRGIDLYTVKEILGHSSIRVTERYIHGGAKVTEAAAVLDGIMSEEAEQEATG